jgi:hypothetical protein
MQLEAKEERPLRMTRSGRLIKTPARYRDKQADADWWTTHAFIIFFIFLKNLYIFR